MSIRNVFLVLVSAIVLASCNTPSQTRNIVRSDKGEEQKIIRLNLGDEPQALDPHKARQLESVVLVRMLFEGLTRVNKKDRAELALAEVVTISPDLRTYTFQLRPSQWTNGDPVTADDFVYAWKKVLDPNYPSDTAFQLYVIKNAKEAKEGKVPLDKVGIRAIDLKTLEVVLVEPAPYFLELTSFPVFFPVNQKVDRENPHWADQAQSYVGNGPFLIQLWKHHDQLLIGKNPDYWDAGHVQLDGLHFIMVKGDTAYMMYEKNELDWAGSPFSTLPVDLLKELKKTNELQIKETLATYFLRCNTGKLPFNHLKLRQAFALAVNRQEIVDYVTQGNQLPATGLVPLSMGLSQAPYFKDADVERARCLFQQALTEINLSKEKLPEIVLTYRASERSHLIAQALQQQWFVAFDIRVRLEAVEGKVFMDRISKQDYQLISSDWFADFNDPVNFLAVFQYKNSGSNNTQWENATYARLIDESYRTINPIDRKQKLAQCEKILIEEMPIIPIFHYTMLYMNRPDIHDVAVSSMGGVDFKWASIGSNAHREIGQDPTPKNLGDIR